MIKNCKFVIYCILLIEFVLNTDKICFIFLHDENSSYDKNFIDAANEICEELGVEAVLKTNIPESDECYNTAKELAESGCKAIFADSFGHEEYILKAAKEYPDVEFGHATGTLAHTNKNITNFHNAFASIYEGRYATGIAAGMKLKEMIDNGNIKESEAQIGYVGAFPYAEVISGYTSFYLGVKSIVNSVKMKVRYTNSWYDEALEKEAAEKLIDIDGCKLISQHADSSGAPSVCEEKGIPNVFYNGENPTLTKSYLISSRINWRPYFRYFINNTLTGTKMDPDWTGNLKDGSVEVYSASSLAATGTQDAVDKAITDLKEKNINVFDTSKFTVNGETLTTYKADVDTDENFEGDTEAISDGYFHESEYRSAPYFNLIIDGISIVEGNDISNNETEVSDNSIVFSDTELQKSDTLESDTTQNGTNPISQNSIVTTNNKGLSKGGIIGITIPLILVTVVVFIASIFAGKAGGAAVATGATAVSVGGANAGNAGSIHDASVHKMNVQF